MPSRQLSYPLPPADTLSESFELAAQQLLSDVIGFHVYAIHAAGGLPGIREPGILISAVYRPFTFYGDGPVYTDPLEQAALLFESIIQSHPFNDGNKRTGTIACLFFLEQAGYWRDMALLTAKEREGLKDLASRTAQGQCSCPQIMQELQASIGHTRNWKARPGRLLSGAFAALSNFLDRH